MIIIKIIGLYQILVSPYMGKHCRFWPSCSQYAILVIGRYGLIKGLFLGVKRLLKCHPWSAGGIDLP